MIKIQTDTSKGVLKSMIGKDMTKMTLPVSFNEPTSLLNRVAEDMEYTSLLDMAAERDDSAERMVYVAAFAASEYASTIGRVAKPFNPLLGETYEYVRPDRGYRFFIEQVSHHPPVGAAYAESAKWAYFVGIRSTDDVSDANKSRASRLSSQSSTASRSNSTPSAHGSCACDTVTAQKSCIRGRRSPRQLWVSSRAIRQSTTMDPWRSRIGQLARRVFWTLKHAAGKPTVHIRFLDESTMPKEIHAGVSADAGTTRSMRAARRVVKKIPA